MKDNILRLNYLALLLNPAKLALLISASVILVLLAYFSTVSNILLVVLGVGWIIWNMLMTTHKIELSRGRMKFEYFHTVRVTHKHSYKTRVKYTVTEIEDLKFEQNALEKLFNCGHFSFRGNTLYESNTDNFDPKTEFTFYGLTHFKQTKKGIYDILGVNETE